MFQLVAHTTSYPDDALCAFYDVSLNASCRAPSSEDGPRADFAAFVEWTLARNRSSFPACSMKNLAGATPDPEPSQPSPRHAEHAHEPTVGGKPEPRATELPIAMESELHEPSDQVPEPAIVTATVGISVEHEYAEDSITHCTTAEGELNLDLGLNVTNYEQDLKISEDVVIKPPAHHELSVCVNFPPTLPQLTPSNSHPISTPPPLSPVNPSAHPQLTICAVGSPQVYQSPLVSWLEDPSSSPPASESWTPPRPSDPAAPPRLSAPLSPPSPVGPPAPPGSIVPPAPPWSVVAPPSPRDYTPPAAPRRSVPPALWSSSEPRSSVAPAPPRTSGSLSPPWSPEPWAPPGPSGSSVSPRIIGSPSPPRALPPPAPPPSVGPMESSAFPPPWLLPPSAPPWGSIMAAIWVSPGSSCSSPLLSPPWLLPPSSPSWTIPSPPWTPSFALLPGVRPPPKPPPKTWYILFSLFVGARTRLPGGGGNVTPLDFLVGFSHHFPLQLCVFWFLPHCLHLCL
ncbi:Opioid growth factor receptor [Labeo rohita]|uniref:Opioid growth factor receptor n=1 Tax=Labeo rohita TaxID=84645 RepID=A0ABQ8LAC5_LABRO|nr:Opioid growth factor receptor [Labeo rohita]